MRPTPLATILALLCGAWAVVVPIVPQLHQTYAGHRHVFCVADQRVEDAEMVELPAWAMAQLRELGKSSKIAVAADVAASQRNGIECLSSNFSSHVIFGERGGSPSRSEALEVPLRTIPAVTFVGVDTFRIAPKTSPPVAG